MISDDFTICLSGIWNEDTGAWTISSNKGNGAAPWARLPEHFGEIVRQIYGTNFHEGGARPAEESN